jgi:hypothetical protein
MAGPSDSLYDSARDLYVVPIRHHSPACAAHLEALLDHVKPAHILIEGPCDFDRLIPLITDPATRPPVAVVSIEEVKEQSRRVVSYFPLCAHSPEYVALLAVKAAGAQAGFIDLPMEILSCQDVGEDNYLLNDELRFDSSDYVRALCEGLGCRDGNEVWDHLFETRVHQRDWRGFFHDVSVYCEHIRAATDPDQMARDGTLAREVQMRALIAAVCDRATGPVVAIVGGFHASAVFARSGAREMAEAASGGSHPYLVRYGHRQLNALTGYGAGLPLPAYYEGLWLRRGEAEPYAAHALDIVTGFAAHLRRHLPDFAPSFPVLAAALENAQRLADLRGRPGPMRDDIIDACRSTMLKGEESGDAAPVMAELLAWMTGSALGDIPPSAGSPPLVEAVRTRARSLGFNLGDGERRTRDLDIYRKERHRAASRFLHGMVFIDTRFAERMAGPDFRMGIDLDRLFEQWSVMWSPMVEARLIERSVDGDTLEATVAMEAMRRLVRLRTDGRGRNALEAIALLVSACQAGIADKVAAILPYIADEVAADPDIASVAEALRDLLALWRNGEGIGLDDRRPVEALALAAWRRALFLLPDLSNLGEEHIARALDALVILREVTAVAKDEVREMDTALFDEAVASLVNTDLHPAIAGAVSAIACLSQQMTSEELGARVSGELGGAYADTKSCVAYLQGVIAVSRELLWAAPPLIEAIDLVLETVDGDDFMQLLPHLRLSFCRLDPADIDRLAHHVAALRNGDAAQLTQAFGVSEGAFAANAAIDTQIDSLLAEAGLS